jgi:hypothetical protein
MKSLHIVKDVGMKHHFIHPSIRPIIHPSSPSIPSWSVYSDRAEKTVEYKCNGCCDRTLAEFIIDIAQHSDTIEAFDQALKKNGAEIPEYFVKLGC